MPASFVICFMVLGHLPRLSLYPCHTRHSFPNPFTIPPGGTPREPEVTEGDGGTRGKPTESEVEGGKHVSSDRLTERRRATWDPT